MKCRLPIAKIVTNFSIAREILTLFIDVENLLKPGVLRRKVSHDDLLIYKSYFILFFQLVIVVSRLKMPVQQIAEQIKKRMNLVEMVVNAKRNIYAKLHANTILLTELVVRKTATFSLRLPFYDILLMN